jgi:hypothetical protein
MCTVLLPPGVNQIAVKCISCHTKSVTKVHHWTPQWTSSLNHAPSPPIFVQSVVTLPSHLLPMTFQVVFLLRIMHDLLCALSHAAYPDVISFFNYPQLCYITSANRWMSLYTEVWTEVHFPALLKGNRIKFWWTYVVKLSTKLKKYSILLSGSCSHTLYFSHIAVLGNFV